MTNAFRTRLSVEDLDDRITPSDTGVVDGPPAFRGLNIAAARFYPTDPTLTAAPVFALNYGTADAGTVGGLNVAAELYPTDPTSPILFGLNGGSSVDTPA
jgi:hypothetical protein